MSLTSGLLARDLRRMADEGGQLIGRPNRDPKVLSDYEFFEKHGHTREQAAERERMFERERFEDKSTADIEQELAAISGNARQRHVQFHAILVRERDKLAEIERKKDQLLGLVAAPAKTQSKILAAIAQTKAWLMGGGDEPAVDRAALDAELATAAHRAQAAGEAIAEVDRLIEVARIRVARLAEAETEFIRDHMREVADASGLLKTLARKRGEVAALERLLEPIRQYGVSLNGKPERVDYGTGHWRDIAGELNEPAVAETLRSRACVRP